MSLPVPLGVRVYNPWTSRIDQWITKYVDDISFRSVIPGGFASATIKLHRPPPTTIYSSATATGTGTSITTDYLVASDADAADIQIGDRVHIYDSTGAIRFGGQPFTVVSKPSAFGFTNITFTPAASASTVSGDVMRCSNPVGYLNSDPVAGNRLADLFNRVQIVDLRTMETVWEGRIEDPARQTSDDTWELGCLGGMVAASDVRRSVFYIDNSLDSWLVDDFYLNGAFNIDRDEASKTIIVKLSNAFWPTNTLFDPLRHQRCQETGMYLGRFDITYEGGGPSQMAAVTNVVAPDLGTGESRVDVTTFTTAATRKGNAIGAANSFSEPLAQNVELYAGNDSSTTSVTISDTNKATERYRDLRVQAQRVDRTGSPLTTSTDYPQEYVTVAQVVEDVVGRFLNKVQAIFNVTFTGQVRSTDVYIDTSSTVQITHLTYFDGTTAAEILTDLMSIQTDAYWAIWETKVGATDGANGVDDTGFRFEWATWPDGWGYQATTIDGFDGQPNGENLYNLLFYQYTDSQALNNGYKYTKIGNRTSSHQALAKAELIRATTIKREGQVAGATAQTEASAKILDYDRVTNTGTLKVSRPIQFFDTGSNSNSGASRMVDPWNIRPGKLIRVTDLPPSAKYMAFQHGDSSPPIELDGTVFKVVATEYNSSDNTCTLELDQVTNWSVPTQIKKASSGAPTTARTFG